MGHIVEFSKKWEEIQREIEQLRSNQEQLEQDFMDDEGITKVGEVAVDLDHDVRLLVTDRRLNLSTARRNWSAATFHIHLNGNPISKRGKVDTSTRTAIFHEHTALP
jgi:hypothetical protein